MFILTVAKFVASDDHVTIVYSDGSKSEELRDPDSAKEEISNALLAKKLTDYEADYLREQVCAAWSSAKAVAKVVGVAAITVKSISDDDFHKGMLDDGSAEKRIIH